jgi:hypothetical protein
MLEKIFRIRISLADQYVIGLVFNILYILILLSNQTSFANLQLPEGSYSGNLWKQTDVLTYVYPAKNFLQCGIFGIGTLPDYHRTIGYPLFWAGSIRVFGDNALYYVFFFQAVIFAFIYPALTRIANILFKEDQTSIAVPSFVFFLVSGTYISMVPVILTDLYFTVFFTLGLWFGLEAIVKKSWNYLILHILFIGYTAQVRPLLSLYPIINLFILMAVAKEYLSLKIFKVQIFLITSTVLLLILCNAPSLRNYINYRFIEPTDILSINMFNYLAKDVLNREGKKTEYQMMLTKVDNVKDISEKANLMKKLSIEVFRNYPLTTLTQLLYNAASNLFEPHWILATKFSGYFYMDVVTNKHMPLKKSPLVLLIFIFFLIVNIFLWVLFGFSLVYYIKSENL